MHSWFLLRKSFCLRSNIKHLTQCFITGDESLCLMLDILLPHLLNSAVNNKISKCHNSLGKNCLFETLKASTNSYNLKSKRDLCNSRRIKLLKLEGETYHSHNISKLQWQSLDAWASYTSYTTTTEGSELHTDFCQLLLCTDSTNLLLYWGYLCSSVYHCRHSVTV